jgi:hypothetical protein
MKKIISTGLCVLSFVVFFLVSCSTTKNQESVHYNNRDGKSKQDTLAYRVINSAPTLNYTVRKVGNGDKVLFSIKNGLRNLPELTFSQNSGTPYKYERKQGFQNVTFPFKCTITSPVNYMTNPMSVKATKINNFEIEIKEAGNWEISFF